MLFNYMERDGNFFRRMKEIIHFQNADTCEMLHAWSSYVPRRFLTRFLAHYELFKLVMDIPGSVVELGVYKGASFFTWSKLLETFCPCDRSRKVYGFDSFAGLKPDQFVDDKDGPRNGIDGKKDWAYRTQADVVHDLVSLHNSDNLIPGIERCILVEGDVFDTVPEFVKNNPGLRISLLHFDLDLYKPTLFCLEQLYHLVIPGGIVCLDEFGLPPWEGETKAVEEFFGKNMPNMKKMPFSPVPGAYFIKS